MRALLDALRRPSLNWLLVLFPVSIVLEIGHLRHASWSSPTAIFICAALAIIPIAGFMGHATEQISRRLGEGIGGLLNATFGNAAELIIAGMALVEAARQPQQAALMHGIVKASLTGSIIGNVLLVLGLALLAGGLRYNVQRFNPTATQLGSTLMYLAVIALLIPSLFIHFAPPVGSKVQAISTELAVLLLVVYALSMVFTLRTHKHLYVGSAEDDEAAAQDHGGGHEPWSIRRALGVLVVATVGVGILAELMVGSVHEAAAAMGMTELFVGVIVVAIVGNAAEHSTAVMVALRNRMDLSLSIAIGSSIQIALFVAPVLVLLSRALGMPMDLVFTVPEIAAVGLAALTVSQISNDGESHWLEGVLLLTVYLMLAVLFFHLPPEHQPTAAFSLSVPPPALQ
ncbi:MAG: calcium/proton exchanger [Fimbriimonadaceae bacterium]|nr:calcium/proton exchanger [Fimbriimonadaceae bacterium]